jgi:hypothetical protein
VVESELGEEVHYANVKDDSRLEVEPQYPSDDCSAGELAEDGWWSPGSTQPCSGEDGAGTQHSMREQSPWSRGKQSPHNETTAASSGLHMRQSSCFTSAKRWKLKKKPERTKDREWEEARQDAWLRQMLSDTSSDEDEERNQEDECLSCSRFLNTRQLPQEGSVPDRRSRNIPEVVLVRRWAVGVLGIWKGRVWVRGGSRGVSLQAT